jgi:hypothetical protein
MKYRIILSLAMLILLAFAIVINLDSGSDSVPATNAAPAPTNYNL